MQKPRQYPTCYGTSQLSRCYSDCHFCPERQLEGMFGGLFGKPKPKPSAKPVLALPSNLSENQVKSLQKQLGDKVTVMKLGSTPTSPASATPGPISASSGSNISTSKRDPAVIKARVDRCRDGLLGDLPVESWPKEGGTSDPKLSSFRAARNFLRSGNIDAAIQTWQQIITDPDLESRHYLQAWKFLREQGVRPPSEQAKRIIGIVFEVGFPARPVISAGYEDHSVCFQPSVQTGYVWKRPKFPFEEIMVKILNAPIGPLELIETWHGSPTTAVSSTDELARLFFLTASGPLVRQGPIPGIQSDPIYGPLLLLGMELNKLCSKEADNITASRASMRASPASAPNWDAKKVASDLARQLGGTVMGSSGSSIFIPRPGPGMIRADAESDRPALFGDLPLELWPKEDGNPNRPWSDFIAARANLQAGNVNDAIGWWQHIIATPNLESRHYVQAWKFLRAHGVNPPPEQTRQILGVVLEMGMASGLEILSVYADYTARYYNQVKVAAIWERPDTSLDKLIGDLFNAALVPMARMGVFTGPMPPPPTLNVGRLNILTPAGLLFAQAPILTLEANPEIRPVMLLGIELIRAFTKMNKDPKKAQPSVG
jgi:hypothetical protein